MYFCLMFAEGFSYFRGDCQFFQRFNFKAMDRAWMTKPWTSLEFQKGVDEFLESVIQNAGVGNYI